MTLVELIPIGTILALLTDQVLITAVAARDVLIEKESFRKLSKYLFDIEPVLKELQHRGLNDTPAARQALEFLKEDVKKAKDLVDKYQNRARFYLLVRCRNIVKEIQDVTRNVGKSLAALSFASTEVLSNISEKVNRLHGEMQKVEFVASQSQLRIVEKLNQGLEQKNDQSFANSILEEIARAVGVPVESSEINEELASLRREKEEAAARKEREEELFLEQVIELLSRADAAKDQEEIKRHYHLRVKTIENYTAQEGFIPPLKTFVCPIGGTVMVDPVSLPTGTTCERAAIEARLKSGWITDPSTGQILEVFTLRNNNSVRQSIEEWRELNYCLKIRSAKAKLQSGSDSAYADALHQLQMVIEESPINKDWIAIEGIIDIVVSTIGNFHDKDLKRNTLLTLMAIVKGHARNKDRVVEAGGIDRIVVCLSRDPNVSKVAIELIFELLHDGSRWNESICVKLKQHCSAILFLVMLLKGTVVETAEKAEAILLKLCEDDDDTISHAATVNWYKPLIDRLCHGPELSRITMVKTLVKIELVDENIKLLGEGVIQPLVEMAYGNLELKDLAFSALVKLSSCRENKKLIAGSGGVPLILEQMFSSYTPSVIVAKCSEILERLTSIDGIEFLVDANNVCLDVGSIITNLICILQNSNSSRNIRKAALRVLLSICKSNEILAEKTVAATNGISIMLPLLEDPDHEIRELVVKLIHNFSQHEPNAITEFLLADRRLETFIGFLEDDTRGDVQMAAAGLLSNLPKSEVVLTYSLFELDVLPILLRILRAGTMEAKENVLGVLFRFVDPSDIEMQHMVVNQGAYQLLVSLLRSGSPIAKARAAALIGNLSVNSARLTIEPVRTGCWCFRSAPLPTCQVHEGLCDAATTFCLLKANALPALVKLLQEHDAETTYEALQALGTLVSEGLTYRGAKVLHEAGGISPMLDVLSWGTPALKEAALGILERVFQAREIADNYCAAARIPLISLSTRSNENGHLGRKAARVLAELERYSKSGSMPLV